MLGSLYTGISGINANSSALSVIGDNIANVNTTAFKGSQATFANILNRSMQGATGDEVGRGVIMSGQRRLWAQGALQNTENSTDLAITGRGFFILDDNGTDLYTRAGQFHFDKDGQLVNVDNLVVQGWDLRLGSPIGGATDDVIVPPTDYVAAARTQQFQADINLDAATAPSDTYSTQFNVWDSLGNEIPLTIQFTKDAVVPNQWDWSASIPAGAGSVSGGGSGTILFNPDGSLSGAGPDPVIDLTLTNGATPAQPLTWNLYSGGATNGSMTQYTASSATSHVAIDGYGAGSLRAININDGGVLSGTYSNSVILPLFQLALADFPSYSGLMPLGRNVYGASIESGLVSRGPANQGALGSITPQSIELSNIDLASEFVNLIKTQRAFQANARVISSSDEILSELINIKR